MESQKGGLDMGSTGEVCVCEGGGVQGRGGVGGAPVGNRELGR